MATINIGANDWAGLVNKAFVPNTSDEIGELQQYKENIELEISILQFPYSRHKYLKEMDLHLPAYNSLVPRSFI